jgi:hypothetical protein
MEYTVLMSELIADSKIVMCFSVFIIHLRARSISHRPLTVRQVVAKEMHLCSLVVN